MPELLSWPCNANDYVLLFPACVVKNIWLRNILPGHFGSPNITYSRAIPRHRAIISTDNLSVGTLVCLFLARQPPVGHGLLIHEIFRSDKTTDHNQKDSSGLVITPTQRPLLDNKQHSRQTSMPPVGFEPKISACERPQTHALEHAATGTGSRDISVFYPSRSLLWTPFHQLFTPSVSDLSRDIPIAVNGKGRIQNAGRSIGASSL
jgi:hypothetical protein